MSNETKINIYLDYINNYLTVRRMAEAYQTTEKKMKVLIGRGKAIFETTKY